MNTHIEYLYRDAGSTASTSEQLINLTEKDVIMEKKGNRKITVRDQMTEFLLYSSPDGDVKVEVFLADETIWLPQKRIAELFGVGIPAISKHLANIFESGELVEDAVISILETTAADGKIYKTKYYNLDAIISVGYRVNSSRATQFRIWATRLLKEYIIKGFTLDDDRLKNGRLFGKDYFECGCCNAFNGDENICKCSTWQGVEIRRCHR